MKGYAIPLIAILLIGFIGGCLGGNGETTPTATTSVHNTGSSQSFTPSTTPTTTSEPTTTTQTQKEPDREELLKSVSEIRRFTYTGNSTLRMVVTIEQDNATETDNVTLNIVEKGYIDYESWSAWVNSTSVSLPDGARTNTSMIVLNNVTYLSTMVGWVKTEDPAASEVLWRYNIVSLAKEFLRKKPDSIEGGEVLRLVYLVPDYKLKDLATVYFAVSPDTRISVEKGKLELYFRDGRLSGGRLLFTVSSETHVDDPTLGEMTITQSGSWEETFEITSINEKRTVKAPIT
ncbi:hypothetical protein A3L11_02425 [Thermococcus siculi]|uniref:Uncharacterized protein n=1 Tax=Thermococcus siculi TaxID=72803 RepID=A0A2Z2MVD1_9EURY|nr:hypothetical protein [Thermococcus siculi]ASJ08143.1 hypothetical protein A3L11_02425 [Thermococcus siculi]